MMSLTREATTVDAWLQWFATEKQAACRAYLCTRYHLNTLDADVLINTARLQVFRHWATVEQPLAYLWHILKHEVEKEGRRRTREQRQLAAYARQRTLQAHGTARTTEHIADLLARVAPRQRHLLEWFAQGYADAQVAAWLQTTPPAVRAARHSAYRALRAQFRPREKKIF
jgi:DNA-binding NarL/FixJ family response regulator